MFFCHNHKFVVSFGKYDICMWDVNFIIAILFTRMAACKCKFVSVGCTQSGLPRGKVEAIWYHDRQETSLCES